MRKSYTITVDEIQLDPKDIMCYLWIFIYKSIVKVPMHLISNIVKSWHLTFVFFITLQNHLSYEILLVIIVDEMQIRYASHMCIVSSSVICCHNV